MVTPLAADIEYVDVDLALEACLPHEPLDQLEEHGVLEGDGLVGLAGAHLQLLLGEDGDDLTANHVHIDVGADLLAVQELLNHKPVALGEHKVEVVGVRDLGDGETRAAPSGLHEHGEPDLATVVGSVELAAIHPGACAAVAVGGEPLEHLELVERELTEVVGGSDDRGPHGLETARVLREQGELGVDEGENTFDVVVSADLEYDVEVSLVGHTRYDEVLVGLVDGGRVLAHVGSEYPASARERALEVLHDLVARSRAQDEDVGSVTHQLLSPL